jgi:hypothetical protein
VMESGITPSASLCSTGFWRWASNCFDIVPQLGRARGQARLVFWLSAYNGGFRSGLRRLHLLGDIGGGTEKSG